MAGSFFLLSSRNGGDVPSRSLWCNWIDWHWSSSRLSRFNSSVSQIFWKRPVRFFIRLGWICRRPNMPPFTVGWSLPPLIWRP